MSSNNPAMPQGVEAGGIGARLVAWVIDQIVPALLVGAAVLVLQLTQDPTLHLVVVILAAIAALAWLVFVWWRYATRGAGPGMKAMGLQLVGIKDGRPIGWGRYFLRQLILNACVGTGLLGVLILVFLFTHPNRQGWHDLAVKSVVVRAPKRATHSAGMAGLARQQVAAGSTTTVGLPPRLAAQQQGFAGQTAPGSWQEQQAPAPTGPISAIPSFGDAQHGGQPAQQGQSYAQQGYAPAEPPHVGYGSPAGQQAPAQYGSAAAAQPDPYGQPYPPQQGGSYPSQARGGYPSSQPSGGYPSSQPSGGYPSSQPSGGYPSSQPSGSYPSSQPSGGYPSSQPSGGYPSSQPSGQPLPDPFAQLGDAGVDHRSGAVLPDVEPMTASSASEPSPWARGASPVPQHAVTDDDQGTHLAPRTEASAGQAWAVTFDDGRTVTVARPVLVGRDPVARAGEDAELVAMGEGSRKVSKTHLMLGTDERGLFVMDRGSTNGTAIVLSGSDFQPCAPGDRVRLTEGQTVSFGDHWFRVVRGR